MVTFATVLGGFVVLVVGYSAITYLGTAHNNLMNAKEECTRAWGNVEVLLERRQTEVGALIDVTREHVDYEQEVLQNVIDARQTALEADSPAAAADADVSIRSSIAELNTLSSEYPTLRADERFDEVTASITTIETRLENRREYYNGAVTAYNARLKRLPESLFARLRGLSRRSTFVASPSAHEEFDVRARFRADED